MKPLKAPTHYAHHSFMKACTFLLLIGGLCLPLQAQWGSRGASDAPASSKRPSREQETPSTSTFLPQHAEVDEHELLIEFDKIIQEWEIASSDLGTYDGLAKYCSEKEYRDEIDGLLGAIHHYDTLLYGVLKDKALYESGHELKVTIREIEKIEGKYKPKYFHKHINDDCTGRRQIEKDRDKIANDLHTNSYDGQALVIDNDIHQYIHRITHLVELIDKHAFHLID